MVSPNKQLSQLGLAPSKARGQNFIQDPNIARKIVEAIRLEITDLKAIASVATAQGATEPEVNQLAGGQVEIIEIGPGLGGLTKLILQHGLSVTAVELDRGLAENLRSWPEVKDEKLVVLNQDILTLNLAQDLGLKKCLVCGNLPYNLSTPILFWFMGQAQVAGRGLFMLQKEMAQRLAAKVGSRSYGRLSVAVSLWYEVKVVLDIPPTAFQPKPKVFSSLVSLKLKGEPPSSEERSALGRLTAAAFLARRKTILNNLSAGYGRNKALMALEELKIDPGQRPETIEPQRLAKLATILEIKK
ncbi:MAG: 16S rRNA (adenine(1518)-N(6)/adenine(1519)-N(6))-dimethyltransferase RsmA [Deltaproteobacteria bacterium]|jgi:16S rRNA (adenine1518-N6/adenine1519-N6)-dimethyltransferase|nr:16S rRNA (adenine(1518)-N(6)/adenine(1519)-N(6))-dimethyltransferase RsmA [Deltaproteobacteria bacterium]